MARKIVILNGSPKKSGNTACLAGWFAEGASGGGATVEIIETAFLKYMVPGCTSCRACQASDTYTCVIKDDAQAVLARMREADTIVMATPLYFWAASAQLKIIIDRMFSLYKWDNAANTVRTPLKGKALVLIASSYDPEGLAMLAAPFVALAEYTGMTYTSLLVPDAGVSGALKAKMDIRERALTLGRSAAAR